MSVRIRTILLMGLFGLSGCAGLGFQLVWTRMFAVGLGHEYPSMLAVVVAFLGGMALGAWIFDAKSNSAGNTARQYAILEVTIAAWGVLSALLIPAANRLLSGWMGPEPSMAQEFALCFLVPFSLLLPATAAMGAAFPAMQRLLSQVQADERCVGAVYGANTAGAVAGVLVTVFFIAPALGFTRSLLVLAALNITAAVGSLSLARSATSQPASPLAGEPDGFGASAKHQLAVLLPMSGCLGIAYEVVGVRLLAQVLENTVYTFAVVLAVYLLGTATGAALYQRSQWRRRPTAVLPGLLAGLGLACVVGWALSSAAQPIYRQLRQVLPDDLSGVMMAEMGVAVLVFGLPTLLMGAVFSLLADSNRSSGKGVGRALAWNTLGGALAAPVFGAVLIPSVGLGGSMLAVGLGYAVLHRLAGGRGLLSLGIGVGCVVWFAARPGIDEDGAPWRVTRRLEGRMATSEVLEGPAGHRILRVNQRFQMGGTAAADAERRQAHLPLLLHPLPNTALFLGLGTGITFVAAGMHPGLAADGVELLPEVARLMDHFTPFNESVRTNGELRVVVADARRFVRSTERRYDVIVSDLFHPALDGAAFLYTREHFMAIKRCLRTGGVFCQWLPAHQLDAATLRTIARTFLGVFPAAEAWLLEANVDTPVVALIAGVRPQGPMEQRLKTRPQSPALAADLNAVGVGDALRFFGLRITDSQGLARFAGVGALNTDDRPRVLFDAPVFSYRRQAPEWEALMELIAANPEPDTGEYQGVIGSDAEFAGRLNRYVKSRNAYLHGLVASRLGNEAEAVQGFIRSVEASPDFTAGYAQCLRRAGLLAHRSPEEAKALLRRLVQAQPANPVAAEMLRRLESR